MRFDLGGQIINPENDGGIKISFQSPAKKTTAWNERIPVLSIDVHFPHFIKVNARQNEKLGKIRRTKTFYTATQAKSSAKCSVKHVTNNSTQLKKCNTRR